MGLSGAWKKRYPASDTRLTISPRADMTLLFVASRTSRTRASEGLVRRAQ